MRIRFRQSYLYAPHPQYRIVVIGPPRTNFQKIDCSATSTKDATAERGGVGKISFIAVAAVRIRVFWRWKPRRYGVIEALTMGPGRVR